MESPAFKRATHLSIVWAVTLACVTLVEWRSLDRDPLGQRIFSPFIEREISLTVSNTADAFDTNFSGQAQGTEAPQAGVQYEVAFHFDGPLFLAYFFGPVLVFHGIGALLTRAKRGARR